MLIPQRNANQNCSDSPPQYSYNDTHYDIITKKLINVSKDTGQSGSLYIVSQHVN